MQVKNLAIFPLENHSVFYLQKSTFLADIVRTSCGHRADIVHTLWYNILIM